MKFLLDENVHRGLLSFLTELGHDVKLSPKSIRNGKVFVLAIKEQRLLVTRDADFLDTDSFPSFKHFGIFLLRVPPRDLEAQKRAVSNLLKKSSKHKEFKGETVVLFSDKKFEFL